MKFFALIGSLAMLWFLPSLHAADAPAWKVQATGLRVVAPAPNGDNSLRAFNWSAGTTVALLVTAPAGKIVDIAQSESKLKAFTDDKGKNLLAGGSDDQFFESGFRVSASFFEPAETSKMVEVTGPGIPTHAATELQITGTLLVQTASQTEQFAAEQVELKKDTKFQLGKLNLTVSEAQVSGDQMEVSFQTSQDLSSVAKLEFYDAAGKALEAQRRGSTSWGMGAGTSVTWDYEIKSKADKIKIVASCWTDLKTVEVPVDVKTGLGL